MSLSENDEEENGSKYVMTNNEEEMCENMKYMK